MERREFADHLRNDVVEFGAIGDAIDEGEIAIARGGPVDALHVLVVEIVALKTPGIEEDAAIFVAGIGGEGPVGEIDFGFGHGLGVGKAGGFHVRVEYKEVVVFVDDELLAVERDLEAFDFGEQGVDFCALVGDIEALQRMLALGVVAAV